jgi:hypothetical protein
MNICPKCISNWTDTHNSNGKSFSFPHTYPFIAYRTASFWDDNALAKIIAGPSSPLKRNTPNGSVELVLGE